VYVDGTTSLNESRRMSTLEIKDLHVSVTTDDEDKEILKGVTLTIKDGETHAIMGTERLRQVHAGLLDRGHPKYR